MKNSTNGSELLKEWVERLGLQEWRIVLHDNMKPDDMTLDDVAGCTVWTEVNRTARIEIMDEKYYGDNRVVGFDYEKTLVHELLHLKTCLISDDVDALQGRIAHMLIDDLARALVEAKRYGEREGQKK